VRVPNDIADLIGIDGDADVTLKLEDNGAEFFLIYEVRKSERSLPDRVPMVVADRRVAI
jgi:hypothetical protein